MPSTASTARRSTSVTVRARPPRRARKVSQFPGTAVASDLLVHDSTVAPLRKSASPVRHEADAPRTGRELVLRKRGCFESKNASNRAWRLERHRHSPSKPGRSSWAERSSCRSGCSDRCPSFCEHAATEVGRSDHDASGSASARRCLEVATYPGAEHWQVANDQDGIAELVRRIQKLKPARIVLEAPGDTSAGCSGTCPGSPTASTRRRS